MDKRKKIKEQLGRVGGWVAGLDGYKKIVFHLFAICGQFWREGWAMGMLFEKVIWSTAKISTNIFELSAHFSM